MINEAILLGYVGKKYNKTLQKGGDLTVLSLATTVKYTDSTGEKKSRTTWHNINCFSKLSDLVNKYVNVGDLIYVRGEILNKKIETGEKAGQYMYSVNAQDIRFLPNNNKKDKETYIAVASPGGIPSNSGVKISETPYDNDFDDEDTPF